jgi:four helix bundle protein
MSKENIVLKKTYLFALKIVRLSKYLREEKKEYELSKQILRSGTSIGANAEEGSVAQTKKDFIAKFSISLKEARETHFWIRLLRDTNIIELEESQNLLQECEEIQKIITSILKTAKQNLMKTFP